MTLRLFGTTFSTVSAADVIAAASAQTRIRARLIVTANVDHIVILSRNTAFRKAYDSAVVRTLDGTPLVWLARLGGARQVARVTGHDLLAAVLESPSAPDQRVFLVCSSDAVGVRAADCFHAHGFASGSVETMTPPYGFETDEDYSADLTARVREHGTTLLVMGVGAPKSEIWVDSHAEDLGTPVVLAVGEALNVVAGLVPRAPVLMQRLGLEWLFRFLHAPRRLFARYFVRSWRFLWIVATARRREALATRRRKVDTAWLLRPGTKSE